LILDGVFEVDWYFYEAMDFSPAHGLLLSEKVSKYDIVEHPEFSRLKPGAVVAKRLSDMAGFNGAIILSVLDNGMVNCNFSVTFDKVMYVVF